MFRFTIRELVLLTLVVAMGAVLWLKHRQLIDEGQRLEVERAALASKRQELDRKFNLQKRSVDAINEAAKRLSLESATLSRP